MDMKKAFEGDKVILIIILLLILISFLAIFSSTPLLPAQESRLDTMKEHGIIAVFGIGLHHGGIPHKRLCLFEIKADDLFAGGIDVTPVFVLSYGNHTLAVERTVFVIDAFGERLVGGGVIQAVLVGHDILIPIQGLLSCVKERKHSLLLERLEVLVICELYLMYKVHNLSKICKVVAAVLYRVLDTAVKVDGKHALRTCGHSAGTEGVAETIVLDLVAQTTAGCERVGVVAHVCEERMSL